MSTWLLEELRKEARYGADFNLEERSRKTTSPNCLNGMTRVLVSLSYNDLAHYNKNILFLCFYNYRLPQQMVKYALV